MFRSDYEDLCSDVSVCPVCGTEIKDHEFEKPDLVKRIMEHYIGVTEEKASEDIDKFLNTLSANNILDDGIVRGKIAVQVPAKDGRR